MVKIIFFCDRLGTFDRRLEAVVRLVRIRYNLKRTTKGINSQYVVRRVAIQKNQRTTISRVKLHAVASILVVFLPVFDVEDLVLPAEYLKQRLGALVRWSGQLQHARRQRSGVQLVGNGVVLCWVLRRHGCLSLRSLFPPKTYASIYRRIKDGGSGRK